MPSYGVYYAYDDDTHEWVESFSDKKDAYDKKHGLEAEIEADDDAEGVRVVVIEEP